MGKVLGILHILFTLSATVQAQPVRNISSLAPAWSKCFLGICQPARGSSLGAAVDTQDNESLSLLGDPLIEQKDVWGLRFQYEQMVLRHEREDLNGTDQGYMTEVKQVEERQGFSNAVADKIKDSQISKKTERAKKSAERDPVLSTVAKPMALVAAAVAITQGRPVSLKVARSVRVTSETHIKEKHGRLSLNSPLLDSALEYQALSAEAVASAGSVASTANVAQHDKVKVSVSRRLTELDLAAGLSYGMDTHCMTSTVSKGITPQLRAEVGSTYSPVRPNDHSFKLLYGLSF